jgi:voltage-gated potassium channel
MRLGDDGSGGPGRSRAMNAQEDRNEIPAAKRRGLLGLRLLRALATTAVLVALYYLLPLDHIPKNVPLTLAAGLLILVAVTVWQVRAIIRATRPALRAVEALAATVPLFLLLFASAYFTMARANPASFSAHPLTRTDALYFTVTTFSTVGFGDITAVSQPARLVVTAQMLLDLLVLGLGIRVFVGAVQRARQQAPPPTDPDIPPERQQHRNDS